MVVFGVMTALAGIFVIFRPVAGLGFLLRGASEIGLAMALRRSR